MGGMLFGAVASAVVGEVVGGVFGDSAPAPSGSTAPSAGSQVAGAVLSATQADQLQLQGQSSAAQADPFMGQRQQYQQQLSQLFSDPLYYSNTAQYQSQMGAGVDAINRSAGARGMLGSGNRLAELTSFGQGIANQGFTNYANLLSTLATQGANPAVAGQLSYGGVANSMGVQNQALGQLNASGIPQQVGNAVGNATSSYLGSTDYTSNPYATAGTSLGSNFYNNSNAYPTLTSYGSSYTPGQYLDSGTSSNLFSGW